MIRKLPLWEVVTQHVGTGKRDVLRIAATNHDEALKIAKGMINEKSSEVVTLNKLFDEVVVPK